MSFRSCAFAVSLLSVVSIAQQSPPPIATGFLGKSIRVGGIERHYVLYLPREYRADRRWPLIVFLNGAGECGTDGWKHIDVGLGPAMRAEPQRWPFVVLFPQKPGKASQWIDHDEMVMSMLAATEKECAIDDKQRFLTGLSQGGAGTWAIGAKHNDVWAALAPVCGYGKPADVAAALKDMPIWAFHGEADAAVPVQQTKDFTAALEAAGGKPLVSLYPQVGHNSWDKAYRDELLPEWLLASPADRRGMWCLADCARAAIVQVTIRDGLSSASGPPFHATTTAVFEFRQKGLTWSVAQEHHAPKGEDGPEAPPRSGSMGRSNGLDFARERLRQLRAGGVFNLPVQAMTEREKDANAHGHACSIEIEIQGDAVGIWQFQRVVPQSAQQDPRFEVAARALRQCIAALMEQPQGR